MPYYDKNAILKALTKEQVIKIVTDLGSKGYRTDCLGILSFKQSVMRDSYKLYYYHEPTDQYSGRTFHCYTSCSESFSIFELVSRAKRIQGVTYTWYQAVSYIANQIDMKAVEHIEKPKHICDMVMAQEVWQKQIYRHYRLWTYRWACVRNVWIYSSWSVFKRPYFQRDVIYIWNILR